MGLDRVGLFSESCGLFKRKRVVLKISFARCHAAGLIGFRGDGVKERSRVMQIHIVIGLVFEGMNFWRSFQDCCCCCGS